MDLGSPQAALRAYIDATNTHDFGNVGRVLHPDAVFWFGDATCESLDDVGAYFEDAWRVVEQEVYAATEVRWVAIGEGAASCVYTYTYEGWHAGSRVSGHGRATNVFTLDDAGEWKLIHEHLSAAPASTG
ncbi:YybH family protein [Lysobacter korlensis]|uniref:YybH family protein n=1 Tax=Lysobacter korlensis TaxID=553636 RepID=A0ABV6S227_9GAMM